MSRHMGQQQPGSMKRWARPLSTCQRRRVDHCSGYAYAYSKHSPFLMHLHFANNLNKKNKTKLTLLQQHYCTFLLFVFVNLISVLYCYIGSYWICAIDTKGTYTCGQPHACKMHSRWVLRTGAWGSGTNLQFRL